MNRLDEGYALVRNPVHRSSVLRVPLTPDQVDLIVFVTKDPSPMLAHLDRIVSDYQVSFQVTVTPYGRDLEPNVPDVRDVVDSFRRVADVVGDDRVIWRYDPVIIDDSHSLDDHLEHFETMCSELHDSTRRCIFSFLDYYRKLDDRLGDRGIHVPTPSEKVYLVQSMADIASGFGIELSACCTDGIDCRGLSRRACIDARSMNVWNIPYSPADVPNRKGCGCVRTVDIGDYDTCMHDCLYCYANDPDTVQRRKRVFDPHSELLTGTLLDSDEIKDVPLRRQNRLF